MPHKKDYFPQRIVCLTEEPTEVLYLLGEESRIVGISGFTVRPRRARKEKPKVSAFTSAKIDEILALDPDLVIGFSDIQADIAKTLITEGVSVLINNHRSVDEIYKMMAQLGAMVGKSEAAMQLIQKYQFDILKLSAENRNQNRKPKIYFEEWYDPLISGIRWVSELIELAGGIDLFAELKEASLAKDRIIPDPQEVVSRNPDIIIASWCGKKFKKERMLARPNWHKIKAIQDGFVFEIKSEIILQPGPAALTAGIEEIVSIIEKWHRFNQKSLP